MATTDATPGTGTVPVVESVDTGPSGPATLGRREARVVWLLLAAAFVAILNETTMGVAIPHLIVDLGITAVAAQWLTTAFMLTMAVVIPITGFLLQRFTTRAMFVAAIGLFSAGTLLALVAPGFEVLIVARVVQAMGTAIMMPLLMTTIMNVVPGHSRGRMMGRVSIVISIAPAIGPTLSGFLLDTLSWRWIFGIVLPIALVSLVIGARWIHNLGETTRAPIDVPSVVLSALGFGGIVYGLSQIGGAESGGTGADAAAANAMAQVSLIVSLSIGGVALGLFVWRQLRLQRKDDALLDLRVFRSANFSLSIAQMAVMSFAFFAQGVASASWSLVADIAPKGMVGITGGAVNFAGNLSGIVTPIAIGFIVKATGSFGWALGLISLFAIAGVLCYLLLLGEVKRIELDDDAPGERGERGEGDGVNADARAV